MQSPESVTITTRSIRTTIKATLIAMAAFTVIHENLQAVTIAVPNHSFESPNIIFAAPGMDSWQTVEVTPPQVGLFDNTPFGDPDYIDNVDGEQVGFIFAVPTVGIYQELSSPGAIYEVGLSYHLTVGLIGGGGGMSEGDTTLELSLYYLDGVNRVNIASNPVTYTAASQSGFPARTHLFDYTVNVTTVQAGEAWVGKNIGIQIIANSGPSGGYWDVENVRLEAVPEPASLGLIATGLAGLLLARPRSRRQI